MEPTIANAAPISQLLTGVALGIKQGGLVGLQLLPRLPVIAESGKIPDFNGQEQFETPSLARGQSSEYHRGGYKDTTQSWTTTEYGEEQPIDDRVIAENQMPIPPNVRATRRATAVVNLAQERRIAALLTSTTTMAGFYTTLAGADQLDKYSTSDPLGLFATAKEGIRLQIGSSVGLKAIISAAVWRWLQFHPQLLGSLASTTRKIITMEEFKALIGIPEVYIGDAMYKSSNIGQATIVKSDVWGKDIIIGYAPSTPAIDEPALGYCPIRQDLQTKEYRAENINSNVVRVNHIAGESVFMAKAGYLIKNAVSA